MLSVRAIYDGKNLKLQKEVDIKKPQHVIVVFLDDPENDGDEEPLTAESLHTLLAKNPALDFLDSEEEDIYSDEDLKVKY